MLETWVYPELLVFSVRLMDYIKDVHTSCSYLSFKGVVEMMDYIGELGIYFRYLSTDAVLGLMNFA